jgi:hypothetical protein
MQIERFFVPGLAHVSYVVASDRVTFPRPLETRVAD